MVKENVEVIFLSKILGAMEEPSAQQLTLYLPNKDKNGKIVKNINKWVKEAQKVLITIGGGSTAMPPADGSWLDPEKASNDDFEKDIVWEKTRIVYTFIEPDKFESNLSLLRDFLHRFGRETNQGEVVFEFDGKFYRIREYDK